MCVSLMATNLVKWWKSKFLNGYKQFTVLPSATTADSLSGGGSPSDTEALLRPSAEDAPWAGHWAAATEGSGDHDDQQLEFQGFECDVSMDGARVIGGCGSSQRAGRRHRKEFSFTLYDLDGRGKITKDDITGLVTTIYETLGSTIRLPHNGSKTIKVKLTVSPEKTAADGGDVAGDNPRPEAAQHRFKRDLNVTIRERRRRVGPAPDGGRCQETPPAAAETVIVEAEGGEVDGCGHVAYRKLAGGGCCRMGLPPEVTPLLPLLRRSGGGRRRRREQRSGSLQRQELLQIIQANMEKNNLSFQTSSRKQCNQDSHYHLDHQQHNGTSNEASPRSKHRSGNHRQQSARQRRPHQLGNPSQLSNCGGRNQYLDLAGHDPCPMVLHQGCRTLDHSNSVCPQQHNHPLAPHNTHHHNQQLSPAVGCNKFPPTAIGRGVGRSERGCGGGRGRSCPAPCPLRASAPQQQQHHHYPRSRSHDLSRPFPYHCLEQDEGAPPHAGGESPITHARHHQQGSPRGRQQHRRATSPKCAEDGPLLNHHGTNKQGAEGEKVGAGPPTPATHVVAPPPPSASSHHLKHRNREEDQARAMAQVVRWLEEGHFLPPPPSTVKVEPSPCLDHPPLPAAPGEQRTGGKRVAGRREYRHIHEHIHHHYHHYQETAAIIV
ncbi:protein naked cuticle [Hetaerina americana]|uniref:protein naked cuticle n=1 Tax=Hetaerina americana TaxID=62018 RepID=UPI003A7F4A88